MKISFPKSGSPRRLNGLTLIELMVSLSVFGLLMAGFISANIFGMRQDGLVNQALEANDQSRHNFSQLMDEIRSCKNVEIGSGTYSNFVPVTNGIQQGNSLKIIPSTNNSVFIYYWYDTNASVLWRASFQTNLISADILTKYLTNRTTQWLTNTTIFKAMDYTGTTNLVVDPTNYNFNYTVVVQLQLAQYQYPRPLIGTNYAYNYYQLTYSATRRSP